VEEERAAGKENCKKDGKEEDKKVRTIAINFYRNLA